MCVGAQVTLLMTRPVAHGMRIPRASFPSATPCASNMTMPELFNRESERIISRSYGTRHLDLGFPLCCVTESVVGCCFVMSWPKTARGQAQMRAPAMVAASWHWRPARESGRRGNYGGVGVCVCVCVRHQKFVISERGPSHRGTLNMKH